MDLSGVFKEYCGKDSGLSGKLWVKMAKDTKLMNKKLTSTDMDLIFAKVKGKTDRKLTYEQFLKGIELVAQKKGKDVNAVMQQIGASKGPVISGTKAEAVKFHDDKSQYTGVHAKGGPSTIDNDKITDISQILDRSPADVRGIKK